MTSNYTEEWYAKCFFEVKDAAQQDKYIDS